MSFQNTRKTDVQNEQKRKHKGAYSICSTAAYICRTHSAVRVSFATDIYGSVSASGGYAVQTRSGSSYSGYVTCPYGMNHVIRYNGINGSVQLSGDSVITLSTST